MRVWRCFFLVVALISAAWAWSSLGKSQQDVLTIYGEAGSHSFQVELADTAEEQAKGLMFRDSLDPSGGMLFVFPQPQPVAFWMKNTFIPLDMIFIDERKRIVGITKMAEPQSLDARASPVPVVAVLEILGGRSDELGIRVGDAVDY